ncbi:hypothetical protein VTL71DRAFT_9667 [Oculimacula yallundae]|uniref:Uncharacterized protein n=1 Tax=Oculimacula yallundae TaxID=86028 RepID=A0ABR4BSC1_9HELO
MCPTTTTTIPSANPAAPSMTLLNTINHASFQSSTENRALAYHSTQSWSFNSEPHRSPEHSSRPDKQSDKSRTIRRKFQRQEAKHLVGDGYFFNPTNCSPEGQAQAAKPVDDNTENGHGDSTFLVAAVTEGSTFILIPDFPGNHTDITVSQYEELYFQGPELEATDPSFGKHLVDLEDWENIYGKNSSPREVRERKYTNFDSQNEIDSEDADASV